MSKERGFIRCDTVLRDAFRAAAPEGLRLDLRWYRGGEPDIRWGLHSYPLPGLSDDGEEHGRELMVGITDYLMTAPPRVLGEVAEDTVRSALEGRRGPPAFFALRAWLTCPEAVARNRPLWLARHRTCTTAVPGWLDMTLAAAVRDAGADPGWGASLKAARMPRLPGDRDALVQCLAGLVVVRADITDPSDARTAMAEAVRREIGEG